MKQDKTFRAGIVELFASRAYLYRLSRVAKLRGDPWYLEHRRASRMSTMGHLRFNVRIGEFCNGASWYPSIATAAFGQERTVSFLHHRTLIESR